MGKCVKHASSVYLPQKVFRILFLLKTGDKKHIFRNFQTIFRIYNSIVVRLQYSGIQTDFVFHKHALIKQFVQGFFFYISNRLLVLLKKRRQAADMIVVPMRQYDEIDLLYVNAKHYSVAHESIRSAGVEEDAAATRLYIERQAAFMHKPTRFIPPILNKNNNSHILLHFP